MLCGGTGPHRCGSGAPSDKNVSPTAFENVERIRELMFAEKYVEADELYRKHLLGRSDSFGTNLPMATLELVFQEDGPAGNYHRWLDLDEGIAHVDYTRGVLRFHRESFAFRPDDVLVTRLTL
jgi:alpha-L-fucosidase 2